MLLDCLGSKFATLFVRQFTFIIYFANSPVTNQRQEAASPNRSLYVHENLDEQRLLTFQVPHFMNIFNCLRRSKFYVQLRGQE